MLVRPGATHQMAMRLQEGTLSLGEAFAFMSGLYFRGKLAYAQAFGRRSEEGPAVLVITRRAACSVRTVSSRAR